MLARAYCLVFDMYPCMDVYPLHALEPSFSPGRKTCRWRCLAAFVGAIDLRFSAMSVCFTWLTRHAAAGPERLRRSDSFPRRWNRRRPEAATCISVAPASKCLAHFAHPCISLFLFRREHHNRADATILPHESIIRCGALLDSASARRDQDLVDSTAGHG